MQSHAAAGQRTGISNVVMHTDRSVSRLSSNVAAKADAKVVASAVAAKLPVLVAIMIGEALCISRSLLWGSTAALIAAARQMKLTKRFISFTCARKQTH